jgi:hypothetical protein
MHMHIYAYICIYVQMYNTRGGFCGHLGFEILWNFAEILRNFAEICGIFAVCRNFAVTFFCQDFEKFAAKLRSQKIFAVPNSNFF